MDEFIVMALLLILVLVRALIDLAFAIAALLVAWFLATIGDDDFE